MNFASRQEFREVVILPNNVVIGERGLSCERVGLGQWNDKPQVFGVVIEEGVFIGANSVVHCGGWRDTFIGKGARIGSLVNIGHNVVIGENCLIAPLTSIAGSVEIGRNVTIWQGAKIAQHLKIGDGAVIGMGAVLLSDVGPGETWWGNPARKAKK